MSRFDANFGSSCRETKATRGRSDSARDAEALVLLMDDPGLEVPVLLTPRSVDHFSDRIERAYLRRRPEWRQTGLDPRLWVAAAAILLESHRRDPGLPLDPELFVTCQPDPKTTSDPWRELTRAASGRRFASRVRKIVRGLRSELRGELRRIERAVGRGNAIEAVLLATDARLSALGRYLAASRMGRSDLMDRLRPQAREQHRACPLYRQACEGLAPGDDYPFLPLLPEVARHPGFLEFSLN